MARASEEQGSSVRWYIRGLGLSKRPASDSVNSRGVFVFRLFRHKHTCESTLCHCVMRTQAPFIDSRRNAQTVCPSRNCSSSFPDMLTRASTKIWDVE